MKPRTQTLASLGLVLFAALSTKAVLAQTTPVSEETPKGPKDQNDSQRETPDASGIIIGKVVDSQDVPVSGACVVLCDGATGVPVVPKTFRTISDEMLAGRSSMDAAISVTDESGQFRFDQLPVGDYRLVAQSWPGAGAIEKLFDVHGKEVVLHGVADHVRVRADSSAEVVLRPLGTGTLRIDEDAPNDEMLLVISTAPVRADPILGFVGWGDAFMQHMIGGNRMPKGEAVVRGLPEGNLHLVVFASDSSPGWGASTAEIKPNETTVTYVPIVAGWSNGQHDPPERLKPLFDEVKTLITQKDFVPESFLQANGIAMRRQGNIWNIQQQLTPHLAKQVELPTGRKTSVGDLMAAARYVQLQQYRQRMEQRRNQRVGKTTPARVTDAEVSYEYAFRDLHQCLGRKYPCFELKGIDWKAVGDELFPRAREVETDAQFGVLCVELVARLEDSHAHVSAGTAKMPSVPFPRWDPGFACLIDDQDKPVVYYVDEDGPAKAAGVQRGMTVLSVDGKPVEEAIAECMKQVSKYQGYSSQRYLHYHAARWFARRMERGEVVSLAMQDAEGENRQFKLPATLGVRYLPRLPVPINGISDTANISWTKLDDNIGYIYVRRIRGDLIERLDQAVDELRDARGLIVDVRGNSGGGFDAALAHRNFALNDPSEPDRPRYKGPMALLIDARCISAGEGWSSWFVANRRARVFGEATAGASARKTTYALKNGLYKVTFPVKAYRGFLGRPIERRGLEPDVPLMPNAKDISVGKDTVLEAARQYLLETATVAP